MPVDGEVFEVPEIDAAESEAVIAEPEAAEPVEGEEQQDAEAATPEEQVEGDGRTIPAKWREAFKADKELKALFYENRELKTVFPGGVNEAKGILKVMSDIGGSEGLAGLQQRAQQLDSITDLATKNPAALLDEIAQAAPGRMPEVAGKAISMWMQEDPDGYSAAVSGLVAQSLKNAGFDNNIDLASRLLKLGHSEDAMEVLQQIKQAAEAFGTAAAAPVKPRAAAGPDPSAEAAKQLEAERAQFFDERLAQTMIAYRDPMIFKEAEQWTKGMTLTERQKTALVRDVTASIGETASKDAKWMAEYNAAVKSRNQDAAFKLYQEKAAKIAPEIVKNVSRELFGSPVSAARTVKPAVVAKPVAKVLTPGAKKESDFDRIWNQR